LNTSIDTSARLHGFTVRLSSDEREQLRADASAARITTGELIRRRSLGGKPVLAASPAIEAGSDLAQILDHLAKAGSNLNQIATGLNRHGNDALAHPNFFRVLDGRLNDMHTAVQAVAAGYSGRP
jgi:hypothetical protein